MDAAETTRAMRNARWAQRPLLLLVLACSTGALLSAAPGQGEDSAVASALPRGFHPAQASDATVSLELAGGERAARGSLVVRGNGRGRVCLVRATPSPAGARARVVITREPERARLFAGRLASLRRLDLGRLPVNLTQRLVVRVVDGPHRGMTVVLGSGVSEPGARACAS